MFGIIVLAVYALLMIGVTLIFTRRANSAESFHVADRRIGSTAGDYPTLCVNLLGGVE